MTNIFKYTYKGYVLKYVAILDDLVDITIKKSGSKGFKIGQMMQMPEEDVKKWFEEYVEERINAKDR